MIPLLVVAGLVVTAEGAAGGGPWIDLPTENRAVFEGRPEVFYMHVDRDFEGRRSSPWEGGKFGFVRGPRRVGGDVAMTRFHEGVDIRPVRRDASGEPLDQVFAAVDGVVVHASNDARASNYGRYIVIEHQLDGSPYYTLYAHLKSIAVRPGQRVRRGEVIGELGYTGVGINKARAHLHFEFCVMLSRRFDQWFDYHHPNLQNRHGIYNGRNLNGMDPIGLISAVRSNPATTPADFIRGMTPMFELTVNHSPHFDLIQLYPWLVPPGQPAAPPAWKITFSDTLIPMKAEAAAAVGEPSVRWLMPSRVSPTHLSRGLVAASGNSLTESGKRFAHLLTFPDQ